MSKKMLLQKGAQNYIDQATAPYLINTGFSPAPAPGDEHIEYNEQGEKVLVKYIEVKKEATKQLCVLVKPSIISQLNKEAKKLNISRNALINMFILQGLQDNNK